MPEVVAVKVADRTTHGALRAAAIFDVLAAHLAGWGGGYDCGASGRPDGYYVFSNGTWYIWKELR